MVVANVLISVVLVGPERVTHCRTGFNVWQGWFSVGQTGISARSHAEGRNWGESISAVVSAISAGEKRQKLGSTL